MGVTNYETFVSDGHTDYFGSEDYSISTASKYNELNVSENSNSEKFKIDLKSHQQGNTDYPTFCNDCAKAGIEKWVVDIDKMTCTYFDKAGNEILEEIIPE